MTKIKKMNIISFAKLQALLFGLIGVLCGIIYSFGGLVIDVLVSLGWITTTETPGLSVGTLLAFGALIGMPLLFAMVGFLAGIAEALLYNTYTKWFSGSNLKHD